ncbi:MAG: MarR family transcriptional regulator [Anaerostipes sp.]|nr:MarR family transcriptional regulator [Anaerostipes sp.]
MANQLEIFMTGQQFKKLCEKQYECIMKKYGITKIEIDILFFLYTTNYYTAKDIVNIRHISKSHVSSAIEDLHKKGYIQCSPDEKDHRRMRLTPAKDAAPLIERIAELHENLGKVLYTGITEEEKEIMKTVVGKMLHNISTALHDFDGKKEL